MDKKLTYFTPTFNRANLLPTLYQSLINQTNKQFVWLIIDDGSIDNTKELVEGWIKEGKIEIDYVLKQNGGKHTAIELSNRICKTEYINCIDSDDFLSVDSTEVLYKYLEYVSKDEKLCGIVAKKAHYDGSPFNESFPPKPEILYFSELKTKYNYSQDTNLIFKTSVIKNYHFPIFEDERFVTESVFYNQFMLDHQLLAIPECLYFAEYQPDGYTSQGLDLFYKNPKGYLYALKQNTFIGINSNIGFFQKFKQASRYYAWKKALKLKEPPPNWYKLKFPYNLLGRVGMVKPYFSFKKGYNKFKTEKQKSLKVE